MADRPDAPVILDAVAAFLRERAVPNLTGADAYGTRIAAALIATVAREWRQGPAADAGEAVRLANLLGRDGALPDLAAELAGRLREGEADPADPAILDHLWRTTLAKAAIDAPRYPRLADLPTDRKDLP